MVRVRCLNIPEMTLVPKRSTKNAFLSTSRAVAALCLAMVIVGLATIPARAQKPAVVSIATPEVLPAGERALKPQTLLVRISKEGKATEVRHETESTEQIKRVLTEAVLQWRFSPHHRDGQPVDWYTRLHIGLIGVPLDEGKRFGLKVASVMLSNRGRAERMSPPRYPRDMMKRRKAATVCVDVHLDDDGRPLFVETPFVDGATPKKGDPFASAVHDAAMTWNFGALEVDGVRYGAKEIVRLPVSFSPDADGSATAGTSECPALQEDSPDALKLLSEPVGKML